MQKKYTYEDIREAFKAGESSGMAVSRDRSYYVFSSVEDRFNNWEDKYFKSQDLKKSKGTIIRISKGVYQYTDSLGNDWHIRYNTLPKKRGEYRWWSAESYSGSVSVKRETKKQLISEIELKISEK